MCANTSPNKNSSLKDKKVVIPPIQESITPNKIQKIIKPKLKYPTNHLIGYEKLSNSTGILGQEYQIIKKSIWYSILSTKTAHATLKVGHIKIDGRISILIALGSGKGKSSFKSTIKRIMRHINKKCEEPSTYHPDQFIGKVQTQHRGKNRTSTKLPGFLSLDYLLIDEGIILLTSSDAQHTESRRALRLGADGDCIFKKNVDVSMDEALRYKSKCVFCIFIQPKSLDQDFVLDGDARRFIIPYVNLHGINQQEALNENIMGTPLDEEELINDFTNAINNLNEFKEFLVDDDALKTFDKLSTLLIQRGFSYSNKIRDFTETNQFTAQNMLLKMSAIQALQNNSNIIIKKHIQYAFVDYCEILEHTYDFIQNKIVGSLNYGDNWKGATNKDQEVLKWLYEKGAISEEKSEVSINEYTQKIMDIRIISERQARRDKKRHEENDWIKSKQLGQHNSKIWLNFNPKDNISSMDRVDTDLQSKYDEIANEMIKINDYPDHPEKSQETQSNLHKQPKPKMLSIRGCTKEWRRV